MHQALWSQLHGRSARDIAEKTLGCCSDAQEHLEVSMINQVFHVDLGAQEIAGPAGPAGFLEQLCILSHLIHAQDLPLTGKLVKAEQFDAGEFFFRGQHGLPTPKLEQAFGARPQDMIKAAQPLGARVCEYGDASVEIPLFARVPLTCIVWGADDEFPARASILFDETAQRQIPLDALGTGVNLAVNAMIH